jgi:hypothetical protein
MEPLLQQLLRSELCPEPGHQCGITSLQVGLLRTVLPAVFIADLDPAFYFNEDSGLDPAFHFNAVLDPYPAPLPCDGNLRFLVCRPSMASF